MFKNHFNQYPSISKACWNKCQCRVQFVYPNIHFLLVKELSFKDSSTLMGMSLHLIAYPTKITYIRRMSLAFGLWNKDMEKTITFYCTKNKRNTIKIWKKDINKWLNIFASWTVGCKVVIAWKIIIGMFLKGVLTIWKANPLTIT